MRVAVGAMLTAVFPNSIGEPADRSASKVWVTAVPLAASVPRTNKPVPATEFPAPNVKSPEMMIFAGAAIWNTPPVDVPLPDSTRDPVFTVTFPVLVNRVLML